MELVSVVFPTTLTTWLLSTGDNIHMVRSVLTIAAAEKVQACRGGRTSITMMLPLWLASPAGLRFARVRMPS